MLVVLTGLAITSDQLRLSLTICIDQFSLIDTLEQTQPDENYNLVAQSYVLLSWTQLALTAKYVTLRVFRLLKAICRC